MRKSTMTLIAVLVGLILATSFMAAQIRESGTIQGNITDDRGEALPGATVTISGSKLIGGARTYITDKNGYYRFPSLPTGPYTIAVELTGFAKMVREVNQLTVDMTLSVDFKLTQASVKEEIVVKANAPTIDVKSSAPGGVVLNDDFLMSVPYQKSVLATLKMAPGIDSDNQSAYGSGTAQNNAWLIDGINTTTTNFGGLHFRPDFNIIKEAGVRGLGLPAEYGEYTGAVINVITKSGSNTLSGLAELTYRGKNWNSQNLGSIPVERFMYPSQKTEKFNLGDSFDMSFQIGGKLIQDKLWFFLSGELISSHDYLPGLSYHETDKNPKFFGKIDYQINQKNRVQFSFIWQKANVVNYNPSFSTPEALTQVSHQPRYTLSGSWTSQFSSVTLLDVKLGYYYQELNVLPHAGLEDVPGAMDLYYSEYTGNVPFYMTSDEFRYHGTAHLSHYVADLMGSHDFKIGGEVQYGKHGGETGYPGGVSYYYYMGSPLYGFAEEALYKDYFTRTIAAFAQDSWTIGKRLTLNYGLRVNTYWFKNPAADLGVLYTSVSLAPRFGFAYDIMGDRKNVVKFHWGHYDEALVTNGLDRIETRANPTTMMEWNGTEWVDSYTYTNRSAGWSVDPKAKQPYMEEFVAGYERELFKNASLEINAYYRKGKRFMGAVLMNPNYNLVDATCYGLDGIVGTADDYTIPYYETDYTNYQEPVWMITNVKKGVTPYVFDDPRRVQKGFEVIFNKRMSNRWQLLASYSYGTSRGNTEQLWTSLGSDPNLFAFANGKMSYYGEPHHFRIQGSVLLPWDVQLGFSGSYMSGTYEPAYAYCDTPLNPGIQLKVKAVGDGTRADGRKNFDLRLEKQFRLGGSRMVTLIADFMNVFNFHSVINNYVDYGPLYGKIQYVQDPRTFQVAARFWF